MEINKNLTDTINKAVCIYKKMKNVTEERKRVVISLYLSIIKNIDIIEINDVEEEYNIFVNHFYSYLKEKGLEEKPTLQNLKTIINNEEIIKTKIKTKNL